MNKKKACIPSLANYNIPLNLLIKKLLNMEVLENSPFTKKTLEYGSTNSPDFVCSPFKYNLGNYIEALNNGADVLIQAGGGCRFGYYAELQEKILRDMGYDFTFIRIYRDVNVFKLYKTFKRYNKKLNIFKYIYYGNLVIKMIRYIDIIEDYIRRNKAYEVKKGTFNKLHKSFLNRIKKQEKLREVKKTYNFYYNKIKSVELNNDNRIKVLIVGELYTVMEPYSNHYIEEMLINYGIEVIRYVNMSYLIFDKMQSEKKILPNIKKYLKYHIGAGGSDSIEKSIKHSNEIDGIIHIKSFGCTPEVNAMPMLIKISEEKKIPILYFSFDNNTSDTGIITRIEAFSDMLKSRKGIST